MLRYAISDRRLYSGSTAAQLAAVLRQAILLAREGVDYFQVREKELPAAELAGFARAVREAVQAEGATMRVVLNGAPSVARSAGVDWHGPVGTAACLPVSTSCHSLQEVALARQHDVPLVLFAPVFGKTVDGLPVVPATGLASLSHAVQAAHPVPVLALGGVTASNAAACIAAGAAGIAAIRMFLRP